MIPQITSKEQVINLAKQKRLYAALIQQIQRDFALSGLTINLEDDIKPDMLITKLHSYIESLIATNFEGFLQLLYRIDIPESDLKNTTVNIEEALPEKAVLALLKREWEKVYYRSYFS